MTVYFPLKHVHSVSVSVSDLVGLGLGLEVLLLVSVSVSVSTPSGVGLGLGLGYAGLDYNTGNNTFQVRFLRNFQAELSRRFSQTKVICVIEQKAIPVSFTVAQIWGITGQCSGSY